MIVRRIIVRAFSIVVPAQAGPSSPCGLRRTPLALPAEALAKAGTHKHRPGGWRSGFARQGPPLEYGSPLSRGRHAIVAAFLLILSILSPAAAQPAEDFYKGKQIRIVVGTTSGGDYDLWGRLLARHITRHIPGNPAAIVENMPGAGTLVATNHLYNVAPRDGTVIGMVSRSMPSAAVMKVANVRFDPEKFNWLGSPEVNHLVLYVNNSAKIAKLSDLFARELIVAGTGPAQGITVGPVMLRNMLGMKLKLVLGYRAPGDMALAASRGEVDAFSNTIGGAAGARRPWVENGQMRVLFNFEPEPVPGLGVPSIFEVLKSDEQRQVMTFFASNVLLGRPLMTTPGVPADRVAVLRRAFAAALKDPALLKEAQAMAFEIAPQSGEKIAALVAGIAATPPDVVARAERAAKVE
jgi:tripartite-type tricarboxylate transporter receptor subunit TctC